MPPEGSDLIFDHRHNADERALTMRAFYAQRCILSHGSLDPISACVQPFPLFRQEIRSAEYSRLSGLAETLWIFRHIFQFCASRPPSPQAALRPAGIQSWQPRRAVTTCLAVSMVRICCSPTLVRLPGSSSACGALPAQGKVLGAPDVIDERRSGLEGERAADGAGQCWGCPGREAELVGDAAAGEGVVAKAGVPRCPAQLTLELLRAGLA